MKMASLQGIERVCWRLGEANVFVIERNAFVGRRTRLWAETNAFMTRGVHICTRKQTRLHTNVTQTRLHTNANAHSLYLASEQYCICLCGIQLVTSFMQAQFNHLGTISEYLHHLCDNYVLSRAYKFSIESVDKDKSEGNQTTLVCYKLFAMHVVPIVYNLGNIL